MGFDVSDRVRVKYSAEGDVQLAITEMRDYIAGEVLALEMREEFRSDLMTKSEIDNSEFSFSLELVQK